MKHIEFGAGSDEQRWHYPAGRDAYRWSTILTQLRKDCPNCDNDETFYKWLEKEWGCEVLFSEDNYVTHISGIDIYEESYTMLLMRFPL